MRCLPADLVEDLTREITGLGHVEPAERAQVLDEFERFRRESIGFAGGGEAFAREMLERSFGAHRAGKIVRQVTGFGQGTRFPVIERTEPGVVAGLLQGESAQTVALVLAHLDPRHAGPILAALPSAMQAEITYRMAVLERPRPEVVDVLERSLTRHLEGNPDRHGRAYGGPEQVAEVLNQVDQDVWAEILEDMKEIHDATASAVKNLMFVFEDIVTLEDRHVQDLLKEIDSRELTYALKAATDEVKEKIFANMSKRASAGIREDMEYLGPVRRSEVADAQQRIIDTIRRLERDGVIVLAGASRVHDVIV